jgi:hypothetical protein
VVFLTTDNHANLINEVFVDRFADPTPVAEEFVTGPIATFTLQQEVEALLGLPGVDAFQNVLDLVGVDCRDLNAYSYGVVDLNAGAGTLTVALKDHLGRALHDQRNPAITCTKTLGP